MTKTEAVQVNLIYLIFNSSIFLVDTSEKKYSKKGTATLLGKTCTIYSNSDSRYHVWKGMPLKGSDIYRSYEATSYTELNEVDPNLFKIPSGYTLK